MTTTTHPVETADLRDCAKTRTRKTTMPFYCRKFRGHDGKCSPYTLAPLTRERWEALTSNHCECGACECSCPDCNGDRWVMSPPRWCDCGAQWFGLRDANCDPVCAACGAHFVEAAR